MCLLSPCNLFSWVILSCKREGGINSVTHCAVLHASAPSLASQERIPPYSRIQHTKSKPELILCISITVSPFPEGFLPVPKSARTHTLHKSHQNVLFGYKKYLCLSHRSKFRRLQWIHQSDYLLQQRHKFNFINIYGFHSVLHKCLLNTQVKNIPRKWKLKVVNCLRLCTSV